MNEDLKDSGKIQIPAPMFKLKLNHAQRRHTRELASKMLKHASAYILVMWNKGDYQEPVAVMDIALLKGNESIVAKCFGKIAQHVAAVMKVCQEQLKMTEAQREQAERVAQLKIQRSKELAAASCDNEEGEIDDINEGIDPDDMDSEGDANEGNDQ